MLCSSGRRIPRKVGEELSRLFVRGILNVLKHSSESGEHSFGRAALNDGPQARRHPIEISCSKEGGRDNTTYVASQRSSAEKKRGKRQWKIKPGSAVTPCSVCKVLAVLIVKGSCRRLTRSSYMRSLPGVGSVTSTVKLPRVSSGSTAMSPGGWKTQFAHFLFAPEEACMVQGLGRKY